MTEIQNFRVGEVRPSQLLYMYGTGSIIDLPKIAVLVMGIGDWDISPQYADRIVEDRLLRAIRFEHPQVREMVKPPIVSESGPGLDPYSFESRIGVPVAPFPRWLVCPECQLLAPISSGLFRLKEDLYRPDRTVYVHHNCDEVRSRRKPEVVPARFMVVCERGHLDDFPWVDFVHHNNPCTGDPVLRLYEVGPSGEARDLEVKCETCNSRRRLSDAFGRANRQNMPICTARRPQLRDYDPDGCELHMRTIVLGASNTWFPLILSAIAIPQSTSELMSIIEDDWAVLRQITSQDVLTAFRAIGRIPARMSNYSDEDILHVIQEKNRADAEETEQEITLLDLKLPEWEAFTNPDPSHNTNQFHLVEEPVWGGYLRWIEKVVLVKRLREVQALIGFTRVDSYGEYLEEREALVEIPMAPITRGEPTWVPANDVRGEGIFIQFKEEAIQSWLEKEAVRARELDFFNSHKRWRRARFIEDVEGGFPGMRYILLHSFSHALMRQFSLECGYSAASLRERIYSRPESSNSPPMAGILIYTSATDSDGTLGGLVSLGEEQTLQRHINQALKSAEYCASDPLCAERPPSPDGQTIHAAACHACLFAPETACERGNKYLDRSCLVKTVEHDEFSFFE